MVMGVRVMDCERFGNGGLAKIVGGGTSRESVSVNMVSKPGQPMCFRIEITGYCLKPITPAPGWIYPGQQQMDRGRAITNDRYNFFANNTRSLIYNNNRTMYPQTSPVYLKNYTQPAPSRPWWHFW